MYFENLVFDATDPQTTGRAWEAELDTETLTDEEAAFETRLSVRDDELQHMVSGPLHAPSLPAPGTLLNL